MERKNSTKKNMANKSNKKTGALSAKDVKKTFRPDDIPRVEVEPISKTEKYVLKKNEKLVWVRGEDFGLIECPGQKPQKISLEQLPPDFQVAEVISLETANKIVSPSGPKELLQCKNPAHRNAVTSHRNAVTSAVKRARDVVLGSERNFIDPEPLTSKEQEVLKNLAEKGKTDYKKSGKKAKPVTEVSDKPALQEVKHPGEIIREKILNPYKLSESKAAKILNVSRNTLNCLIKAETDLSKEMAYKIQIGFPEVGLTMMDLMAVQTQYDEAQFKKHPEKFNITPYPEFNP